jgi:hypothetical protein
MNDPFVLEQSQLRGKHLVEQHDIADERMEAMFLEALGRKPTSKERSRIESYLSAQSKDDPAHTWASLAHIVFNMKEFIFIP